MSLSVTNSLSLRIYYGQYSTLVKSANRKDATAGTLSFADASALRNAVRKLQDYKFEDATDAEIQEKLKAFTDAVNSTLESGSKYSGNSSSVRNAVSKIKSLNNEYASKLKQIGITAEKDGTLSVYESASKLYSKEKFSQFFDKDSEYLNNLYTAAQKITRRVDVRI
ncbi:MAG: hypothetical protein IKW81_08930 [Pseudobutyrivibrio sp.]|nr:hypothetical protein [Pseudobutyrivibrio sp.]